MNVWLTMGITTKTLNSGDRALRETHHHQETSNLTIELNFYNSYNSTVCFTIYYQNSYYLV